MRYHPASAVLLTLLPLCILTVDSRCLSGQDLPPHDRPDCVRVYFPLAAAQGDARRSKQLFAEARQAAIAGQTEAAFNKLWQAHHTNPADAAVRRALALPPRKIAEPLVRPGRGAPPILGWRPRTYLQCETPHFAVYSTASRAMTIAVAERLERFYWVWSQVFFPLWEGRTDIRRGIQGGGGIGSGNEKLQVVLFRDADAYVENLQRHVPGVERSTGFYSDQQRCTFLFAGRGADPATWYHELTHQLLREATRSKLRVVDRPGETAEFWLIEGIACYMESVRFGPTYALVGGWESPRLQYARYRWLSAGDRMTLAELVPTGRQSAQQLDDIARWYAHAAAYTHLLMDNGLQDGRASVFAKLQQLYDVPLLPGETTDAAPPIPVQAAAQQMVEYLTIDDERLFAPDPQIPLQAICLGHTRVTADGIANIAPQSHLQWLNLSYLPVDTQDVRRLVADASSLDQLSLENTRIDDTLSPLLAGANKLTELDLSFTAVSDRALNSLSSEAPLETLFLTGTRVGDAAVKQIVRRETLQQIDVQRSEVSEAVLEQLKRQRPNITFNPLQLITQ
ncbi:leucine-rich repeat domain-containing protein [Roseimaritima ulvae]|uniref:Leucine Rich repeats (2 copies) n=1 Tax=Roseimaritima ulvae TaxID=980254 RepID=A0A5B9QHR6_9BACT|nr:hypothetical protein [Roseimaritima ulvae]QEG38384.1 hypothetical protein UC8_03410 [Roseimaritima ulvae]